MDLSSHQFDGGTFKDLRSGKTPPLLVGVKTSIVTMEINIAVPWNIGT